jgi:hypothetical protein
MLKKKELSDAAKPAYAAQVEWWVAQPDSVKDVLLNEDPQGWGWIADMAGNSAGTTVSGAGESSAATTTPTSGGGGGSSRPWVDYSSNRSYSSNYVPRSSSSSYRGGGSSFPAGGSTGSGDQPVLNQILSLDPFLATGEDDGRRAVAIQVSDHVSRIISAFSMFTPDKRMAQFFTGMWMQLIGRMLGPNPDMAAWTTLLARLTKQAQQGQATPAPQPRPGPRAEEPIQTTESLGGY